MSPLSSRSAAQASCGSAATGRGSSSQPRRRKSGPLPEEEVARIGHGLRIPREYITHHSWCDNGPSWRAVMLRSAEQVLALKPDPALLAGLDVGVVGPYAQGDVAFELRAFFPGNAGLTEDPVTGSLNAAVAQWLIAAGLAPPHYTATQGGAMGRARERGNPACSLPS